MTNDRHDSLKGKEEACATLTTFASPKKICKSSRVLHVTNRQAAVRASSQDPHAIADKDVSIEDRAIPHVSTPGRFNGPVRVEVCPLPLAHIKALAHSFCSSVGLKRKMEVKAAKEVKASNLTRDLLCNPLHEQWLCLAHGMTSSEARQHMCSPTFAHVDQICRPHRFFMTINLL